MWRAVANVYSGLEEARRVTEISRASTGPSSSMVYSPIRLRTRPRKVRTAQMRKSRQSCMTLRLGAGGNSSEPSYSVLGAPPS